MRNTPVHEAEPPDSAKRKTTPEGRPAQSMTDLPSRLGSPTLDEVSLRGQPDTRFIVTGEQTELEDHAFALLELPPEPRVYNRLTVQMMRIATTYANPRPLGS